MEAERSKAKLVNLNIYQNRIWSIEIRVGYSPSDSCSSVGSGVKSSTSRVFAAEMFKSGEPGAGVAGVLPVVPSSSDSEILTAICSYMSVVILSNTFAV